MTKGIKVFRIVICVLLALTMIWSGFLGATLLSDRFRESVIDEEKIPYKIHGIYKNHLPVSKLESSPICGK